MLWIFQISTHSLTSVSSRFHVSRKYFRLRNEVARDIAVADSVQKVYVATDAGMFFVDFASFQNGTTPTFSSGLMLQSDQCKSITFEFSLKFQGIRYFE